MTGCRGASGPTGPHNSWGYVRGILFASQHLSLLLPGAEPLNILWGLSTLCFQAGDNRACSLFPDPVHWHWRLYPLALQDPISQQKLNTVLLFPWAYVNGFLEGRGRTAPQVHM